MKLKLHENIKNYRKEKGLTQEKLAEALGVTVGAVSKWEMEFYILKDFITTHAYICINISLFDRIRPMVFFVAVTSVRLPIGCPNY